MQDLNVSLIQTELFWENKPQNLALFSTLINSFTEETDIIVLPEMFTTGFSMQPELFAETMIGETVQWMLQTAKEIGSVITGSIIIKEGEKYYNRLIWAQPNGETFYYDKRHLFTLSGEEQHYSAGKEKLIIEYKDWKICLLICYDLRFPVWCRNSRLTTGHRPQLQNDVYDLLLFVANWPEKRSAAWKTLLQARAIENQSYTIGVNRIGNDGNNIYHSGNSSVIDPMGDVVFSQSDLPFVKTFTLSKERLLFVREKLPFLNDADNFSINI
jgi:omega-amidase